MPKYTITDPESGRTIKLIGDSPPTEEELENIFASVRDPGGFIPPTKPPAGTIDAPPSALELTFPKTAKAKGAAKIAGVGADLMSAPGTTLSAIDQLLRGAPKEDVRTALKGESKGFGRGLVESPELGATAAVAPFTGGLPLLKAGLAEALAAALGRSFEQTAEGQKIDPIQETGQIATETVLPKIIQKGVPAGVRALKKGVTSSSEQLSGVSGEALEKYGFGFGKGAKELKAAAKTQYQVAEDLVDALDNAHKYLPEEKIIQPALDKIRMAPVDEIYESLERSMHSDRVTDVSRRQMQKLLDELKGRFGTGTDPVRIKGRQSATIQPSKNTPGMWEARFEMDAPMPTGGTRGTAQQYKTVQSPVDVGQVQIPAGRIQPVAQPYVLGKRTETGFNLYNSKDEAIQEAMKITGGELQKGPGILTGQQLRDLRIRLDKEIGDKFGEAGSDFIEGVKNGRRKAQEILIKNTDDPKVAKAFQSEAAKFQAIDALKEEMGASSRSRRKRAEAWVNTLFGKNKTLRQQRLEDFQNIFGGEFMERSKMARLAADLGETGEAKMFPQQFTGRSLLGVALAEQLGLDIPGSEMLHPAIKAATLSMTSPRIAAGEIASIDQLLKMLQYIPAKPTATAGRRALSEGRNQREQAIKRAAGE